MGFEIITGIHHWRIGERVALILEMEQLGVCSRGSAINVLPTLLAVTGPWNMDSSVARSGKRVMASVKLKKRETVLSRGYAVVVFFCLPSLGLFGTSLAAGTHAICFYVFFFGNVFTRWAGSLMSLFAVSGVPRLFWQPRRKPEQRQQKW